MQNNDLNGVVANENTWSHIGWKYDNGYFIHALISILLIIQLKVTGWKEW